MTWHTLLYVLVWVGLQTEEQIDYTIEHVSTTVLKLREMSPLWEMFKEGIDMNSIEWAHH